MLLMPSVHGPTYGTESPTSAHQGRPRGSWPHLLVLLADGTVAAMVLEWRLPISPA